MDKRKILPLVLLPFLLSNSPAPDDVAVNYLTIEVSEDDYKVDDETITLNFNNDSKYYATFVVAEGDDFNFEFLNERQIIPPFSSNTIRYKGEEVALIDGSFYLDITYKDFSKSDSIVENIKLSEIIYEDATNETTLNVSFDLTRKDKGKIYRVCFYYFNEKANAYYSSYLNLNFPNYNETKKYECSLVFQGEFKGTDLMYTFEMMNDYYNHNQSWPYYIPYVIIAIIIIAAVVVFGIFIALIVLLIIGIRKKRKTKIEQK